VHTKSMEERVTVLESCAFHSGRDLAAIKSAQRDHTTRFAIIDERLTHVGEQLTHLDERMTSLEERLGRLEHGIALLLDHHGITHPDGKAPTG
jgi:chromosome segregation ATPase